MTLRKTPATEETAEPPIAHHYFFILVLEVLLFLVLAWTAARFR